MYRCDLTDILSRKIIELKQDIGKSNALWRDNVRNLEIHGYGYNTGRGFNNSNSNYLGNIVSKTFFTVAF